MPTFNRARLYTDDGYYWESTFQPVTVTNESITLSAQFAPGTPLEDDVLEVDDLELDGDS